MNSTVRIARRNMRNAVNKYSEVQVKVREATSNDPWGPDTALMSQISDFTHNIGTFTDVMQIVWRRLSDHGKNWRHVFKSLVLLDYLVKTGNERVARQCRENLAAIEILRDFQHYEDGHDHGRGIRDRSVRLVSLLKDEERLEKEREKAQETRSRLRRLGGGFGSESTTIYLQQSWEDSSPSSTTNNNNFEGVTATASELSAPKTAGEEEMQLQLALAISKEEAERRQQPCLLEEEPYGAGHAPSSSSAMTRCTSVPVAIGAVGWAVDDLLGLDTATSPVSHTGHASQGVGEDPWLLPANSDNTRMSGSASLGSLVDPWAPKSSSQQHEQRMFPSAWPPGNPSENNAVQPAEPVIDPWLPIAAFLHSTVMTSNQAAATLAPPGGDNFGRALTVSPVQADSDLFVDCSPDFMEPETDCLRPTANVCSASSAGFPVSPSCLDQEPSSASSGTADQSVHSFLDANSKLVNLDDLSLSKQGAVNPFAPGASSLLPGANPFHPVPSSVSMNQLKSQMQEMRSTDVFTERGLRLDFEPTAL